MPDWQLTPEEEIYGDQPVDINDAGPLVDANGMPLGTPNDSYPQPQQPAVNPDGTGAPTQQELDQAFPPQPQPPRRPQQYPPRQPQPYPPQPEQPQPQPPPTPRSPPADPSQPRPYTA
jgi:penicillin-binding protein 1A